MLRVRSTSAKTERTASERAAVAKGDVSPNRHEERATDRQYTHKHTLTHAHRETHQHRHVHIDSHHITVQHTVTQRSTVSQGTT